MGRGARKPTGFRHINGILLLDKPKGVSSNQALQKIRHLFKANKAGHTGSLDPLATGMLPICFGEATKFSAYLLNAGKSYRASCQLGKTTTTGDAEGEVTSQQPVSLDRLEVEAVLRQFIGQIEQIPPMYSALKVQGQRLYRLARNGVTIERATRIIEIHSLELVEFQSNQLVIDVFCSKGTYLRTLAEDIGQSLGCGAYLSDLCRTGVHPFWRQRCYSLKTLQNLADLSNQSLGACLLPVQAALSDFPVLTITHDAAKLLQQGRVISSDAAIQPGLFRLVNENGHFIGMGETADNGLISPKRLMNTLT